MIVGGREDLKTESFMVDDLSWTAAGLAPKTGVDRCLIQVRHRQEPLEVEIKSLNSQVEVRFIRDWTFFAPGQAAVFYDLKNEAVLGGGKIVTSSRANNSE